MRLLLDPRCESSEPPRYEEGVDGTAESIVVRIVQTEQCAAQWHVILDLREPRLWRLSHCDRGREGVRVVEDAHDVLVPGHHLPLEDLRPRQLAGDARCGEVGEDRSGLMNGQPDAPCAFSATTWET